MQLFGYKNGDMTQGEALEGFKNLLNLKRYTYNEKEGKLIVNTDLMVNLREVNYIPKNICFSNGGHVDLSNLEILPENTVFKNNGNVYLESIEGFSKGVRFENSKNIYGNTQMLNSLSVPEISQQKVINCYIKQIYG